MAERKNTQKRIHGVVRTGGRSAQTAARPERTASESEAVQQQAVQSMPRQRYYYDYSLLCALILIFAIGLIVIYSSSQYMAMQEKNNASYYFKRQLVIGGAGLIAAVIASLFDYRLLKGVLSRAAYIGSCGLLVFTLVGGLASHGKTRWLQILGGSFQPTELAKIGLIVFMAAFIAERGPNMNKRQNWSRVIIYGLIPTGLIASQNISSGVIVAMITAIMMFVALDYYKIFFALLAAAGAFIAGLKPALHWIIIHSGMTESPSHYALKRVFGWAAPEIFEGDAYQTVQGLYAIGSGGMTGHGLGDSIQKYGAIPEVQNDMIFTIVCEEFGFIGAATIVILYIYILVRIYKIAVNARDLFGTMLCTGVMAHLGLQAVLNIAVVTAVIPNTGVTLPFISYGGSAILFTMLEMGIVLSVAHRIRV